VCTRVEPASYIRISVGPLAQQGLRSYNNCVVITYDPKKCERTLKTRGLDFKDADEMFEGACFEVEDLREDYGAVRMTCFGMLRNRMVVVGYTPRGADRHVFSMRKANDREQTRIAPLLGV
jgi:uncharacterized protein